MSEKPTVTIPDLHHVEIQTTIHVPIGDREICVTTTSEYDQVNREVNLPPFHLCAAHIERLVPTCSADGADLERLDIYIYPDNAPLKTKDFAYKHFMGKIAAENLWREYEKERLNRKEEHK